MSITVGHYGDGPAGATAHKGNRDDCPSPECAWPREGDLATVIVGGVERTGELTDLDSVEVEITTSSGRTFRAQGSTIRKPDHGGYCPHGLRIDEALPVQHTHQSGDRDCLGCYPPYRTLDTWPCGEEDCTREAYDQAIDREVEECYEEMWTSYHRR